MGMFGIWPGTEVEKSVAQAEKDEAIHIARNLLGGATSVSITEAQILARQLLKALALPDRVIP